MTAVKSVAGGRAHPADAVAVAGITEDPTATKTRVKWGERATRP